MPVRPDDDDSGGRLRRARHLSVVPDAGSAARHRPGPASDPSRGATSEDGPAWFRGAQRATRSGWTGGAEPGNPPRWASDAELDDRRGRSEGAEHALEPVAPSRRRPGGRRPGKSTSPDRLTAPDEQDHEPDPHDVARSIVLRQLERAPRSRVELRKTLSTKGCDPQVSAAVLDRLIEVGLVDDVAYAETFVRSRQSTQGLAGHALAYRLRDKGVSREVIEQVLGDVAEADPEGERRRARELVDRKLRTMHGLVAQVQYRRLMGMLARKGYSGEVASSVVRSALADSPEHQRD